jgi:hypothetical protein
VKGIAMNLVSLGQFRTYDGESYIIHFNIVEKDNSVEYQLHLSSNDEFDDEPLDVFEITNIGCDWQDDTEQTRAIRQRNLDNYNTFMEYLPESIDNYPVALLVRAFVDVYYNISDIYSLTFVPGLTIRQDILYGEKCKELLEKIKSGEINE